MFAILESAVYLEDTRNTVAPESEENSQAIIRRLAVQEALLLRVLGTKRARTHTFGM